MSTKTVTVTFTLHVQDDSTIPTFGVTEAGIPPEDDDDNPETPEGIASKLVHQAVREAIHSHNEAVFNSTLPVVKK